MQAGLKANSLCSCAAVHVHADSSLRSTQQIKGCDAGAVNGDLLVVSGHADVCCQTRCISEMGTQNRR